MNNIIVSKNKHTVRYLTEFMQIRGDVIEEITNINQIYGKHVYGALPLHLACAAKSLTVLDMHSIPEAIRQNRLTYQELIEYQPQLITYKITLVV